MLGGIPENGSEPEFTMIKESEVVVKGSLEDCKVEEGDLIW